MTFSTSVFESRVPFSTELFQNTFPGREEELLTEWKVSVIYCVFDFVSCYSPGESWGQKFTGRLVHVGLYAVAYGVSGSEPLDDLRGVRPRFEDFRGRGFESSGEGEAGLGEHKSFSTKAARRSSCAVQKRW